MEFNDNQFNQKSGPSKGRLFVFIGSFIGLVVLVAAPYYIWDNFFDAQAVSERKTQKQYEAFLEWEKKYEETMKNDTYGGKTPQETLDLFVAALQNDDLELASKYFALGDYGEVDEKWINGLYSLREKGDLVDMIVELEKMQPSFRNTGSDKVSEYVLFGNDGIVDYSVIFKLNLFSNVWKIESL
ncbi:hypothetical protein GW950_01720 [Candidatus Wolfebacteria bacterium]|nr:hypothetical protein [Candidatus Wolfebacteria bacterium]